MHVIIDFCVVPIGVGTSVSSYIAECEKILEASGLNYRLHAYGTNVEGPWEQVMDTVYHCHEKLHEMGVPRISTSMRMGTRTDKAQSMDEKIESVQKILSESQR